MDPQYRYYAVTNLIRPTVEDPFTVLRVWEDKYGATLAEAYTTALGWKPTDQLDRINRGHDLDDLVPITLDAVERFKVTMAERVRNQH
jgi:hypothetical protein